MHRLCLFPVLSLILAVIGWKASAGADDRVVGLLHLGWHVDLVIPVNGTVRHALPPADLFPEAPILAFGWGDSEYYRASSPSASMALGAVLIPGPAVLHVRVPDRPPADPEALTITVSEDGFAAMLRYIARTFARDASGKPRYLGAGLSGPEKSRFYRATGRFHIFNTCNRWVAGALAAAGLSVDPQAILTAASLMAAARTAKERRQR